MTAPGATLKGRSARPRASTVALVFLLLAAACATDRVARELDGAGRMTKADALTRLGAPTRIMTWRGEEVWSYEDRAIVGSLPLPSSPVDEPGPFVGRTVRQQILLFFDSRGVLSRWERF